LGVLEDQTIERNVQSLSRISKGLGVLEKIWNYTFQYLDTGQLSVGCILVHSGGSRGGAQGTQTPPYFELKKRKKSQQGKQLSPSPPLSLFLCLSLSPRSGSATGLYCLDYPECPEWRTPFLTTSWYCSHFRLEHMKEHVAVTCYQQQHYALLT